MARAECIRIPRTRWTNSSFKNSFFATPDELIGTPLFLLFAYAGTEVANIQSMAIQSKANTSTGLDSNTTTGGDTGCSLGVLLYIGLFFGFSPMVNI